MWATLAKYARINLKYFGSKSLFWTCFLSTFDPKSYFFFCMPCLMPMNASSWFEITDSLLVVYFTDYWFSLLLGCPLSWPQMGSICIMVLCLARDHRAHRWHRHTGTIFRLFYRLHRLIFLVNGNQSLIIIFFCFF